MVNDCAWTLVHLHYISQFHTFQGNHQSLQRNVCAAHVNNLSSNLIECTQFQWLDWRCCGLVTFFRINNIELKCSFVPVPKISQVMMKWCRRVSHFGRFTLWNKGHRARQPGRFTLWHYGRLATQFNSVDLLYGTTDAVVPQRNNPVWCMHQE